ncbi:Uncharacterised protein [Mycobacterium tuberculosis]|nr:Uncharacterised protein [Mycobacterium tuberculosis]
MIKMEGTFKGQPGNTTNPPRSPPETLSQVGMEVQFDIVEDEIILPDLCRHFEIIWRHLKTFDLVRAQADDVEHPALQRRAASPKSKQDEDCRPTPRDSLFYRSHHRSHFVAFFAPGVTAVSISSWYGGVSSRRTCAQPFILPVATPFHAAKGTAIAARAAILAVRADLQGRPTRRPGDRRGDMESGELPGSPGRVRHARMRALLSDAAAAITSGSTGRPLRPVLDLVDGAANAPTAAAATIAHAIGDHHRIPSVMGSEFAHIARLLILFGTLCLLFGARAGYALGPGLVSRIRRFARRLHRSGRSRTLK